MKRKFLEDLGLEKEAIDKILDENSADIGKAKGEVETLTSERDQLKTDIKDRDKQLEELKKTAGASEELKRQIETLQADNATKTTEYEGKIKQMQIETAFKEELAEFGVTIDPKTGETKLKLIKALVSDILENPELVEGKIKGLSDRFKKYQSENETKALFGTTKRKGFEAGDGDNQPPTGITKEQFSKMGYKERTELFNSNKELYDQLSTN